jgi:hypothetical protein
MGIDILEISILYETPAVSCGVESIACERRQSESYFILEGSLIVLPATMNEPLPR